MCTLMILHKTVPGHPVVVAANRDEYRSRKSQPPSLWEGSPAFFAGKDLEEGGTWLGLNSKGLLVGILNRRSEKSRDDSRLSRGRLCVDALKHSRLEEARMAMEEPLVGVYNPFNLFYADGEGAYVTYCQEEQKTVEISPGFHILANGDLDDVSHARLKKIFELAQGVESMNLSEAVSLLKSLCRYHAGSKEPLDSVCIHTEKYGTVSSTIIALNPDRGETLYLHVEDNPCQSEYKELSPDFNSGP